ncbi:hypothetical protein, partial [Pseudomonas aeruginosa]
CQSGVWAQGDKNFARVVPGSSFMDLSQVISCQEAGTGNWWSIRGTQVTTIWTGSVWQQRYDGSFHHNCANILVFN